MASIIGRTMGGEGIEGGEGTKGEREVKDGKKIHSVRPFSLSLSGHLPQLQ